MENNYGIAEKKALLVQINNKILTDKINNDSLKEYDKIFINNNENNNERLIYDNTSEVDKVLEALWMYIKDLFKRLIDKELTKEQLKNSIRKLNENLGQLLIMFTMESSENINSPYGEYSCMQIIKK